MSPIPTDVYNLIFDEIITPLMTRYQHKRTFQALALVCRLFRVLCLPRLFQHMSFKDANPRDGNALDQPRWCDLLTAGDEEARALAHYVRRCAFLQSFFMPPASAFPNVTMVCLYCVGLTHTVLDGLAQLPALCAVNFLRCPNKMETSDLRIPEKRRGGWTAFQMMACGQTQKPPVTEKQKDILLQHLARLVDCEKLLQLVTDDPDVVDTVLDDDDGDGELPLKEMHITVPPTYGPLLEYLARRPNLEVISLQCTAPGKPVLSDSQRVPDSTVPRLREAWCDSKTIRKFMGRRPISRIAITDVHRADPRDMLPEMHALSQVPKELRVHFNHISVALLPRPDGDHAFEMDTLSVWMRDIHLHALPKYFVRTSSPTEFFDGTLIFSM